MLPTQVMNEFGQSFVHRRIGSAIGGFFGGGPVGAVSGFFGPQAPADPCPGGFKIPGTNRCFETPFVPAIEDDIIPHAGQVTIGSGAVTPGAFGALSVDPVMMSTVRLRCPTGLVLGKDDRCYAQGKGGISNSQRKWPKAPRAIMSAQDGKILRKADAVRGRVKRVAATAGFTCKKK